MPLSHVPLLSLDSLIAGCALAPLLPRASGRLAAAGLFGAADAAGSALGALVSLPFHGVLGAAPGLAALYALYLAAATCLAGRGLEAAEKPGPSAWVILGALAAALSLDNVASPVAAHAAPAVAVLGVSSAALMLLGLAVGARVLRGLPDRSRSAWLAAGVATTACLAVLA
jgi:hypothetical protein